jgi:hypothetical protein
VMGSSPHSKYFLHTTRFFDICSSPVYLLVYDICSIKKSWPIFHLFFHFQFHISCRKTFNFKAP